MSTREMAYDIINGMDEEQLESFIILFSKMFEEIPNDTTIAAMKESEELLKDTDALKFDSVDDLFKELRA